MVSWETKHGTKLNLEEPNQVRTGPSSKLSRKIRTRNWLQPQQKPRSLGTSERGCGWEGGCEGAAWALLLSPDPTPGPGGLALPVGPPPPPSDRERRPRTRRSLPADTSAHRPVPPWTPGEGTSPSASASTQKPCPPTAHTARLAPLSGKPGGAAAGGAG